MGSLRAPAYRQAGRVEERRKYGSESNSSTQFTARNGFPEAFGSACARGSSA